MLMFSSNINPKYASIIEKYLSGRGDDDENNKKNFDLHNIDRFGVFHPEGIHNEEESEEEKQRFARRLGKWRDMTANLTHEHSPWTKLFNDGHPSEKLIRRTFKGIPAQFRMVAWPMYLSVALLKRQNPGVYSRMLDLALATSDDLGQIDLDIMRTFRNTTYFCDRFGPRQQALFRILAAYSVYNKEVGYCQGMSELVGMLLTYIIEDEDVFWAFSQLMVGPKHYLHCVFKAGFPGLTRQLSHHEVILKKMLPSLSKHFGKLQLDTSCYALKWFMQCFMDRLPLSLVLRLWDVYLLEGECILFAMAYNILKLHKKRLLQMDEHQILSFFQDELPKDFKYSDELAIESLKDCLEQLHRNHLARPALPGKDMLPQFPLGQTPSDVPSTDGSSAYFSQASLSGTSNKVPSSSISVRSVDRRPLGIPASGSTPQVRGTNRPHGLATSAAILTMSAMSKHSGKPTGYNSTAYSERHAGGDPTFARQQSRLSPNTGDANSSGLCYSLGNSQYPVQYKQIATNPRSPAAIRVVKAPSSNAVPYQPDNARMGVSSDHADHHHHHRAPTTNNAHRHGHFISIKHSPSKVVDALNPDERRREVQRNHQINRAAHSGGDQSSSRSLSELSHHNSTTKPTDRHVTTVTVLPVPATKRMISSSSSQSSGSLSPTPDSAATHNHRGNDQTLRPEETPQRAVKSHQSVVKVIPVYGASIPSTSNVRVISHRYVTTDCQIPVIKTQSSTSSQR